MQMKFRQAQMSMHRMKLNKKIVQDLEWMMNIRVHVVKLDALPGWLMAIRIQQEMDDSPGLPVVSTVGIKDTSSGSALRASCVTFVGNQDISGVSAQVARETVTEVSKRQVHRQGTRKQINLRETEASWVRGPRPSTRRSNQAPCRQAFWRWTQFVSDCSNRGNQD